ncbi:MAG TPA: DNA polymerase III subunit delta [Marinilabiliaceae bacterium]|nr:DNA polymerase III subunit delta [Marinilabiliaceae bacterium]
MTFEEILKQVSAGEFAPIYFLSGEEPYFIDKLASEIQAKALKEEERGFNETVFYGKDADATNVVHAARRYPMGAPRQLIMLREAQQLDGMDLLESYFKNPQPSTILVISYKYKSLDKRTKIYNALKAQKQAVIFEGKKLYDNQMGQWINGYLKQRGLSIEPQALIMLTDFLGTELEKVVQAVDKLVVAMGPGFTLISSDHVYKNIGISKEYNTFELQKALYTKDVLKANRIVKAFSGDMKKYPMPAITAVLFGYFSKLLTYYYLTDKSKGNVASQLKINPFFVSDYQTGARNFSGVKVAQIISLLREYDMKSKGFGNVNTPPEELLQEMVYKILH